MGTAKWTGIAVGFQCGIAYIISFIVYQIGTTIATGQVNLSTVLAILSLLLASYYVFRKPVYQAPKLSESVTI